MQSQLPSDPKDNEARIQRSSYSLYAALTYAQALYRPSSYYLNRLLGGNKKLLSESANTTEVICDGGRIRALPFFFQSDQLDRIRDSVAFSAKKIIRDHFHREYFDLYPLRVYHFRDAWLINGSIFLPDVDRMELRNRYQKRSWIDDKSLVPTWPVAKISQAVLGSGIAGSSWFGHWLEDELPLQMFARTYGPVVSHTRPRYSHELPYLEQLGLSAPMQLGSAHFQSLTVIDEFAQNPDKVRRFLRIREALTSGTARHERLYIRRGQTGTRREILNEEQLYERLLMEGFGVVSLEHCTFNEMHEACRQARLIVGIEGSHLAHALFMAGDHACLVILNPPNQTHTTVADLAPFCRLSAAMYVCLPDNAAGSSYTVDIDEVLEFIESAERFAAHHAPATDAFIADLLTRS